MFLTYLHHFIISVALILPISQETIYEKAFEAFQNGHYELAQRIAIQDEEAENYALACRASLTLASYFQSPADALISLHKALDYCQKALMLNPDHIEANLSYALAIGLEGKRKKNIELGRKSRLLIENLLLKNPEHPMVEAALAGWHSGVASEGFLARIALGASVKTADFHFQKSLEKSNDKPIRFEYGRFLMQRGQRHYPKAIDIFQKLQNETADHAFEAFLIKQSQNFLILLQKDPSLQTKAIKKQAKALEPFANIKEVKHIAIYSKF